MVTQAQQALLLTLKTVEALPQLRVASLILQCKPETTMEMQLPLLPPPTLVMVEPPQRELAQLLLLKVETIT